MSEESMPDWVDEMMTEPTPPFKAGVFYNETGDYIEATWRDVPQIAERINNSITLIRDLNTAEIIGIQIKNVKAMVAGKDPNKFHRGD